MQFPFERESFPEIPSKYQFTDTFASHFEPGLRFQQVGQYWTFVHSGGHGFSNNDPSLPEDP
jgi:hypothetical protein